MPKANKMKRKVIPEPLQLHAYHDKSIDGGCNQTRFELEHQNDGCVKVEQSPHASLLINHDLHVEAYDDEKSVKSHQLGGQRTSLSTEKEKITIGRKPATMEPKDGNGSSKQRPSATSSSGKQAKIPRPPNAWILYRAAKSKGFRGYDSRLSAWHDPSAPPVPIVSASGTQLGKNADGFRFQQSLSKVLSAMWSEESAANKQYWHNLASQKLREHQIMYPTYKYLHPGSGNKKKTKSKPKTEAPTVSTMDGICTPPIVPTEQAAVTDSCKSAESETQGLPCEADSQPRIFYQDAKTKVASPFVPSSRSDSPVRETVRETGSIVDRDLGLCAHTTSVVAAGCVDKGCTNASKGSSVVRSPRKMTSSSSQRRRAFSLSTSSFKKLKEPILPRSSAPNESFPWIRGIRYGDPESQSFTFDPLHATQQADGWHKADAKVRDHVAAMRFRDDQRGGESDASSTYCPTQSANSAIGFALNLHEGFDCLYSPYFAQVEGAVPDEVEFDDLHISRTDAGNNPAKFAEKLLLSMYKSSSSSLPIAFDAQISNSHQVFQNSSFGQEVELAPPMTNKPVEELFQPLSTTLPVHLTPSTSDADVAQTLPGLINWDVNYLSSVNGIIDDVSSANEWLASGFPQPFTSTAMSTTDASTFHTSATTSTNTTSTVHHNRPESPSECPFAWIQ